MPVNQKRRSQKRRSQKRRSQKRRVGGGFLDWLTGKSTDGTPTAVNQQSTGTPTTSKPTAVNQQSTGTPTGTPTTAGPTLLGGKSRKMRRQRR